MKPLYQFIEYRDFLKDWGSEQTTRGIFSRMAEAANVTPSMISQVLKSERHFTSEQASAICDFLGLTEHESEFFLTLVELSKAGTPSLKRKILRRLKKLKEEIRQISNIALKDLALDEASKARFYSSWLYTALHCRVSLSPSVDLTALAKEFRVSFEEVQNVFQFLIDQGLIVPKGNKFTIGAAHSHIEAGSALVNQHHRNWRLKGIETMDSRKAGDLFYTCPMSLSVEAAEQVRMQIPQFIEQILKIIGPSECEETTCLNIDWFRW